MRLDDFKAALKGGVRPNKFRVIPSFPYGGDVQLGSFLIKTAALPGQTLGEIPVPFRGRFAKLAGDRVFDNWDITVLIDGDFSIRDSFEVWSNAINSHAENIGEADASAYQADWIVEQLDRNDEVIKTYTLENVWPQVVAPVELGSDNTDTLAEFTVTMTLENWSSTTTS